MKIFCINLKRATERKEHIQKEWIDKLGLQIDFWSAYDRRLIDQQKNIYVYNENDAIQKLGRKLSNGEIACATSFYQLFEYIISKNIKECIIIEDDIIPLINNKQIIFDSINLAKQEFPIMQMLLMHKIHPMQLDKHEFQLKYYGISEIFSIQKNISSLCTKAPWGNQCFYITNRAIEFILSKIRDHNGHINIWHPADHLQSLYLSKSWLVGILNNPICDHDWVGNNSVSYIGNEYRATHRQFIE